MDSTLVTVMLEDRMRGVTQLSSGLSLRFLRRAMDVLSIYGVQMSVVRAWVKVMKQNYMLVMLSNGNTDTTTIE
ncbi:hypothetical protein FRX31_035490, partial [Thalictrum thalictroides]